MAAYNLDEKSGLLGGMFGGVKSPVKIMKSGDTLDLKHYHFLNLAKASVTDVNDSIIKIKSSESSAGKTFAVGEPVTLHCVSGDSYVISGELGAVSAQDPLQAAIKVLRIEKVKDLKKSERCYTSLPVSLKVIGVNETIPAVARSISFGGVKVICKEDIMLEDVIDVIIRLGKDDKVMCKGTIVRKTELNPGFEYGIEYKDIGESNIRNLHRFLNQFLMD